MTSTGSLNQLKRKWQFASFLMQTPVMLTLKYFIRTFVLASKSPKDIFLASLRFSIS